METVMEIDEFWRIVETARQQPGPVDEALVDLLAARSPQEVIGYQRQFDLLHRAVYRWDLWAAAHLLEGGCSDDGFTDFRAGLIVQGRDWYEKAARSPDSLADHPAVLADAPDGDCFEFSREAVGYAAARAYERLTGDRDDFYAATSRTPAERAAAEAGLGKQFDFEDDAELARHLPRLAALYR
ncbi:DUF4240 domain-containing protein [Kitasatospora sp. NPDC096147]|uniref:DUF4240 domain-containing protein n=1 Tax=Kitasatospora sp. NPDC096147 TaxID=3364093 RepID=UPI00381C54DF